jgi:arylsulfatase A-like enzyme
MNRRDFLKTSLVSPLAGMSQIVASGQPNILLIVADDLGYAEIGVQGCKDIPTPNIDSIARNGVRFTSGYVSCPVCSPTRAGLITGRYQQRFGHEFNPGPASEASDNFGLPLSEETLADRLKLLGYRTGLVGKWHLGYKPAYLPLKRGFDEFFGFPGGAHNYIGLDRRDGNPLMRGNEAIEEKEYLTDAFAREAVNFVGRGGNRPFFLYLAFNAVHNPLQATATYKDRLAAIADDKRRTYGAMMLAMDDAIGQVLAKVRQTGGEENTLIFFISDNGGPTPQTTSKNTPLRGYKGQVWEGGIRVPFLMQWKKRLPAGRVYDSPVIALDIFPTSVAAAGGKLPSNLDGVDLAPFVTGANKASPHDALCWRFGAQSAIRKGDWKLARTGDGEAHLSHLASDIGESKNLAATDAAKLKEMEAAYNAWNRPMAAPKWRPADRGAKRKRKA